MKNSFFINSIRTVILLFICSVNSFSQVYNCSGTPDHVDLCGGTYISLTFSCRLSTPSLPGGLTYTYDGTNGNSIIQGLVVNSEQSVPLIVSGGSLPFIIIYIHAVPTVTSTAPASRCDAGTITLGASASAGTINWYNILTGGTSLATGTSYSPIVTGTTTYYVDATNSGTGYSCTTVTRTPVIATVNSTPSIVSTIPGARCDAGTVTLGATASAGTINWYSALTGGTSLGMGTSYTTPTISNTTTYYVDATSNGCTSSPRTPVIATINTTPTITGTTPDSRCDAGNVYLGATASAGTVNWYAVASGGSVQGTGTTFVTSALSTTTTFYVEATDSGCVSSRVGVVALIQDTCIDSLEIMREQNTLLRIDTAVKAWQIQYLKSQLAQGKYTSYDTLNISLVIHDTTQAYIINMQNLDTIVNMNGYTAEIKIYPNPVGEILNIECSENMTSCTIYNTEGIAVIGNNVTGSKTQLDVSSLISGEYLLKINLAKGGALAGRLVIKK